MNSRLKKFGYTSACALGLFAGAAGVASAVSGFPAQTGPTPTTPAQSNVAAAGSEANETNETNETNEQAPNYTSSVTVASGTFDNALAPLARITADDAKNAALAAVSGTAGQVELENENGMLVYGVEVATTAGEQVDVKVDAGNGKVLAQEADDGNRD